jgi:flagellar hook assembly protein FlgD
MQDARSKKQDISLKIYDASGRLVKDFNLQSEIFNMQSSVVWNGTDQNNRAVPAGVYFVSFKAGDYKKTEKAILLR